jgi:sugar (pentulose or hexulose) kinase
MYAMGEPRDLKDVRQYVPIEGRYTPDMKRHELYSRLLDIYQDVYHGLASRFPEICEIQSASIQGEGRT